MIPPTTHEGLFDALVGHRVKLNNNLKEQL